MKKYKYTSQQIANWQRYGIQKGIMFMLKDVMRKHGLDANEWMKKHNCESVAFVIPTPSNKSMVLDYPYFEYNGSLWYIDMILFDDETQIHLMGCINRKHWENGGWHTVREALSLADTMVLYEYIEERLEDLILLDADSSDQYNLTGALDVGLTQELRSNA